jgi:Ca2+-binding RTX toxin-like protein
MGGDDTIDAGTGNDTIVAEGGVDRLEGGAGDDLFIHYNTGSHVITDAEGVDTFEFINTAGSTLVFEIVGNDLMIADSADLADGVANTGVKLAGWVTAPNHIEFAKDSSGQIYDLYALFA